jgi:Ribonuclease G/E
MIWHHVSPGEQRTALLLGGGLREFHVHRPAAPDGVGALHWARVVARVPAMAGAFLALAEAEAFLPDTEGGAGLTVGDGVVVRITRAGQGGKGPRASARVSEAERALGAPGAPRLLRAGPTPLEELRAAFAEEELRVGAFPDALEAEIEALALAQVDLPGGMRATISPTPALTAIDLDGGAATAARAQKASAQFAANREAIPALARQIRLRNLSGAILIDFAGMPAKRRAALGPVLAESLAADRVACRLAGFSALGFAELIRPRLRPPLHEVLRGPHAAGLAALRQAAAEALLAPGRRLALRAAPGVVAALQADGAALAAYAQGATYKLVLRSDPNLGACGWILETDHG